MVCLMCLIPLFLVPIVNLLPLLFDFILGKVYSLFGWEYRKPERAPAACPYKPVAVKSDNKGQDPGSVAPAPMEKSMAEPDPDDKKLD